MRGLHRFFTRWQNLLGLFLVLFFIVVAIAAPKISPDDPNSPGPMQQVGSPKDFEPRSPLEAPPLGTMSRQIDVYHALVWGSRSAITFGLTVAGLAALIGILIGAISAYFGGFLNNLLMRITDAFLSFPIIAGVVLISQLITSLLYAAGLRTFVGAYEVVMYLETTNSFVTAQDLPPAIVALMNVNPVSIAFIMFSWMPFARMMNTMVMRIKNMEYVEASKALGSGHGRLIFRHLIPNAITPLIVMIAKDVGGMVLLQATFTFIGLGGGSPWGMMLISGRDWIITKGGIFTYWWVFVPATVALVLFGVAWNLLGDGLNDALNPRTQ